MSPHLTDSAASRNLIAVIPAERYILDPTTSINLTLQTLYLQIAKSCNQLSRQGVKMSDPVTHETVVRLSPATFCFACAYTQYFRKLVLILAEHMLPSSSDRGSRFWMCGHTSLVSGETGRL